MIQQEVPVSTSKISFFPEENFECFLSTVKELRLAPVLNWKLFEGVFTKVYIRLILSNEL